MSYEIETIDSHLAFHNGKALEPLYFFNPSQKEIPKITEIVIQITEFLTRNNWKETPQKVKKEIREYYLSKEKRDKIVLTMRDGFVLIQS